MRPGLPPEVRCSGQAALRTCPSKALGGGGVQVQMGWGKQFGQLVQKLRGGSVLSELREQQG